MPHMNELTKKTLNLARKTGTPTTAAAVSKSRIAFQFLPVCEFTMLTEKSVNAVAVKTTIQYRPRGLLKSKPKTSQEGAEIVSAGL